MSRHYWRARGKAERVKFISLKEGYHGTHMGGTSINGNPRFRESYEPLLPYCYQIDTPWLYRNPYSEDAEELGEICAGVLEREILTQGPNTVAAFIAEPIQGAGGVIVPPANYWPRVREICNKYEVLLIADEVVTGFGRSGTMFGSRTWGVKPDIMTLAKGITSGYIPLGATLLSQEVVETIENAAGNLSRVMHGYTYSGHPVACAAGIAALDIVEQEDLPGMVRQQETYFLGALAELKAKHEAVGDVRGKGLMAAIELVSDRKLKSPVDAKLGIAQKIAESCKRQGVMVRPSGAGMIILSPPLVIARQELSLIISAIDQALAEVFA
ncbi:MAG: aminotransferase class III-fold pyridoxal phosphate-dependent enzyme [Deinococcales bacterium]